MSTLDEKQAWLKEAERLADRHASAFAICLISRSARAAQQDHDGEQLQKARAALLAHLSSVPSSLPGVTIQAPSEPKSYREGWGGRVVAWGDAIAYGEERFAAGRLAASLDCQPTGEASHPTEEKQ